jgi:hypothetical protein
MAKKEKKRKKKRQAKREKGQKIEASSSLKDRLGDLRGGSEWEPIKILLLRENSAYTPNS